MKKSEKIEVRLSYDEKTALSEIAEQEGRSVSQLVRNLIARYVEINTTRLPKKKQWGLIAALLVGGFFAGHLMTYFIAKSHHHDPIYRIEAGFDGGQLNVPIIGRDGQSETYDIQLEGRTLQMTLKVKAKDNSLPLLMTTICQKTDKGCAVIAEPVLALNPRERASIMLKDQDGSNIIITARPNPHL